MHRHRLDDPAPCTLGRRQGDAHPFLLCRSSSSACRRSRRCRALAPPDYRQCGRSLAECVRSGKVRAGADFADDPFAGARSMFKFECLRNQPSPKPSSRLPSGESVSTKFCWFSPINLLSTTVGPSTRPATELSGSILPLLVCHVPVRSVPA